MGDSPDKRKQCLIEFTGKYTKQKASNKPNATRKFRLNNEKKGPSDTILDLLDTGLLVINLGNEIFAFDFFV